MSVGIASPASAEEQFTALDTVTTQSQQFTLVQALRGIAAAWVVFFHASEGQHIPELYSALPRPVNAFLFNGGEAGVAIFFALSGFVIAHSLRNIPVSWGFFGRFALRRSIRLDPPYWASILLALSFALLSATVKHEAWEAPNFGQIVAHLFYLQSFLGYEHINIVYWTLVQEVQFYLFFAIMLIAGGQIAGSMRRGAPIVWSLFYILALASAADMFAQLPTALFLGRWSSFFVGALAYVAALKAKGLQYLIVLAIVMIAKSVWTNNWFSAVSALTALFLFCAVWKGYAENGLNGRWLQFLGAISYSLYLTHNNSTGAIAFVARKSGLPASPTGDALVLLLIICGAVAFATVFWAAFERPAHRFSRYVKLA